MTEIPEHLLKRSKARRAELEGTELPEDAPAEASAATPAPTAEGAGTPAVTLAAPPPESVAEAPPKPEAPYVVAARTRPRAPVWVIPVLAFIPVWALLYANVLRVDEAEATGLTALGGEVFASAGCTACHGATGGGGVGPQLSGGEVLLTFPALADQVAFVTAGSGNDPYGDPARPGGQRVGTSLMPSFSSLSPEEILAVVCHERVVLSGAEEPECDGAAASGGSGEGDHG